MFTPPQRNYNNVQAEGLRRKHDAPFTAAHDQLSDAYYNFWKQGNYTKSWRGYKPDQNATQEEAKALFDKLHGYINAKHEIKLYEENESDEENFNEKIKHGMEVVVDGKTRMQRTKDVIASLESEGINPSI